MLQPKAIAYKLQQPDETIPEEILDFSKKYNGYKLMDNAKTEVFLLGDVDDYLNINLGNFDIIKTKYNLNNNISGFHCFDPTNNQFLNNSCPISGYVKKSDKLNLMPKGIYNFTVFEGFYPGFKPVTVNLDEYVQFDNSEVERLQKTVIEFFKNRHIYEENQSRHKGASLIYGAPGCHAKGTQILMFDGSIKNVEDIRVGDFVMGPDSTSREVLRLVQGKEKMVEITPIKGEPFVINYNHMLHLTPSGKNLSIMSPLNIKFSDWLEKTSECFKEKHKLTKTGVDFSEKELPIPPYILGAWLGDGHTHKVALTTKDQEIEQEWVEYISSYGLMNKVYNKKGCKTIVASIGNASGKKWRNNPILRIWQQNNLIDNKHIPQLYKTASREQRLELLAGLIDTDGHLNQSSGIDYITKLKELSDDIIYLARSLGFGANYKKCRKQCVNNGVWGTYYRIHISGDLDQIPTRLKRKQARPRKQIKDVLRTGFSYKILPEDEYYGFTLNKDHLYLTGDFFIHHNCGKSTAIMNLINSPEFANIYTIFIPKHMSFKYFDDFKEVFEGHETLIIMEEMTERLSAGTEDILNFLDGYSSWNNCYVIATTNYPETLPPNLVDRPGRFNHLIEVKHPNEEQKVVYFKSKGFNDEEIASVLSKTKDFSMDYIAQLSLQAKLQKLPLDKCLHYLEENKKKVKGAFRGKHSMGL